MTDIPEHLLRRSRERARSPNRRQCAPARGHADAHARRRASARMRFSPPRRRPNHQPESRCSWRRQSSARRRATAAHRPARQRPELGSARPRIKAPMLAMLLLLLLPLWAVVYLGAFGSRAKAANSPITAGAGIYNLSCSACHGAAGQGGSARSLPTVRSSSSGRICKTTSTGSRREALFISARRSAVSSSPSNAMPGFGTALSAAQIADVVCYERVNFGGAPADTNDCPAAA